MKYYSIKQSKLASIATNSSRIQLDSFALCDFRFFNALDLVFYRVAGESGCSRRLMGRDFFRDFDLAGGGVFDFLVQVLVFDLEFGGVLDFRVGVWIGLAMRRRRHGGRVRRRRRGFCLIASFVLPPRPGESG
jgi:hypothetical protein